MRCAPAPVVGAFPSPGEQTSVRGGGARDSFPGAAAAATRTSQSSFFNFAARPSRESSERFCSGVSPRRCSTVGRREEGTCACPDETLWLSPSLLMYHSFSL